uniref:VOC domain-containing protein n=1 Tax=Plectus sambesii TaxID=2011161 RepID=A0A914VWB4_9BILA
MTQTMPAPRMTLITLGVNDLKLSTKFYQEGLGWPLSKISNDHVSFFDLEGIRLGLYGKAQLAEDAHAELGENNKLQLVPSEAQQLPFNGITMAHNVNSEEEVDRIIQIAVKAGAKLQASPSKKPWGYTGYFRDPDGYFWEVACCPAFPV